MPAQYVIWSKFHIQTTKPPPPKPQNLKKWITHTNIHIYPVGKKTKQNKADATAAFLARSLGKCINTTSFLSY